MMPIPMGANPMTHLPSMMGPPPPPAPHHMPHPHHHQGPIPLAMIARINADIDNQLQMQEQQQIEEHIIPIFQQLLPELRPAPESNQEHHHQQQQQKHQEAEDRAMPNKVLYHPAMAEGRSLYTVAISDKPNGEGPPMMHHHQAAMQAMQAIPSEAVRQNAPMFQRVPIHVPVSMMMPPGAGPSVQQQDGLMEEHKPDNRPHCKYLFKHYRCLRWRKSVDIIIIFIFFEGES